VVLLALAKPLGAFMARVYQGERTFLGPLLHPVERLIYRAAGVRADEEMSWKVYAIALMLFNGLGLLAVYVMQRLQGALPLNPQGLVRSRLTRRGILPSVSPRIPIGRVTAAKRR